MKLRLFAALFGSLIFLFAAPGAYAATYYVSSSGSDSNSGTSQSSPWKSLSKVNSRSFSAGDKILFRRGDTFDSRLSPPSSGTNSAPIIFGAYGSGASPIINNTYIMHRDYVTLQNLHVKNDQSSFAVQIQYSNHVLLEDLEAEGGYGANIFAGPADYLTIRRVNSHHSRNEHGIYLDGNSPGGTDYPIVEDSELHHNAQMGLQFNSNGVYRVKNPIVRRNKIHNNGYLQVNDLASDNLLFHHNLLYGNSRYETIYIGYYPPGEDSQGNYHARNGKFYNNVFILENGYPSIIGMHSKVYGTEFKNNIFYSTSSISSIISGFDSDNSASHNCFYYPGISSGLGSDSKVANPQFVSLWSRDFHLQSGSPCIDAGINVGLTADFAGSKIPQGAAPDIGAYEYGSSATEPPSQTGDADSDGDVDGVDYMIWKSHYNSSTTAGPAAGDFNSDQTVDGLDYMLWKNNYTG